MKVHDIEITYNKYDRGGIHDFANCKYTASMNSESDCYDHLVWFLTKSEESQSFYLEILSIEVKPL